MNTAIKNLLDQIHSETANITKLQEKLQKEYNRVFSDSETLNKAISNAENSSEYQFGRYGDIESWYRFSGLSDYAECREYFETWLSEKHCMRVDWENDCLIVSHGDDNILIQDDTRHDNGVWQSGKLIIDESEYKSDGEVNEVKRNALIEAHMEKSGYFPGVYRTKRSGGVYAVNTQA